LSHFWDAVHEWVSKQIGPDLYLLFKLHYIWSVDSQKNYENCCHQMSYFKANMH